MLLLLFPPEDFTDSQSKTYSCWVQWIVTAIQWPFTDSGLESKTERRIRKKHVFINEFNTSQSESFWNQLPNHFEPIWKVLWISFEVNPLKINSNVIEPRFQFWWSIWDRVDLNQFFNPNESEIRITRIYLDWKFDLVQSNLKLITNWKLGLDSFKLYLFWKQTELICTSNKESEISR